MVVGQIDLCAIVTIPDYVFNSFTPVRPVKLASHRIIHEKLAGVSCN